MRRPDWSSARRLAFDATASLPAAEVALAEAIGQRLAAPLVALCALPHYASSAMDGWAVAGPPPWRITDDLPLAPGLCRPIVTGAAIPTGTTAVLRSEHAAVLGDRLDVTGDARPDEPRPGEHVRQPATEAALGERLIDAGTLLTPAHLALAASAGHDTLSVVRRPRVALVLTGDEVVPSGIPPAGRVRDSFGPVLPALLASLGAITAGVVHLRDDPAALRAALLDTASGAELLVSTGGTGDSSADHLRAVLSELGAVLLVDGVRMRPGGPSILARLPDGRLVLGLPGNPLAAMMGILTLGVPLLARMTGGPFPEAATVTAAEPLPGRADTSFLVPYRLTGAGAGAVATDHRGAAMMRGLAAADGVLVCPPSGLEPGQAAASIGLPWR